MFRACADSKSGSRHHPGGRFDHQSLVEPTLPIIITELSRSGAQGRPKTILN